MASTLVWLNGSTAVGFPGSRKPHLWKKTERDRLEKYPDKCHSSFFLEGYKDMCIYTYIHTVNICPYIHIPHTYTHMYIYIYINRFCKTIFHSTARSGLSKTKVRMVEATILKTFLPGLPWTSLPRQEKVQASKPFWYPSNSFCHARKEKAPHVLVPIFKGPPALPLHEKSRQSNISSFHVPLNYSFYEYAQGSASVFLKKAWPVWSPGLPRANPLGEYAQTVVHLECDTPGDK